MKRSMKKQLQYRIGKGIRFMNREYGRSWLRKIDPEQLALDDGAACIIGQVEGDYCGGVERLGISHEGWKYGFDLTNEDTLEYRELTSAWRKQVRRLQKLFKIDAPDRYGEI